ncbi:MAG: type I secretion system permease/ATPase [Sneathiella sp.]|uniref:type I secretion system permease/ATPase n=1 Tax=Sneathiella sp. TaxID=1964365 RepID=UPI000C4B6B1B|nr:type I secretion system permease/ATPase [Sneathiella sp.]MAL80512.1 type I secretion system permease/ATPase [Sneathiella sp.]
MSETSHRTKAPNTDSAKEPQPADDRQKAQTAEELAHVAAAFKADEQTKATLPVTTQHGDWTVNLSEVTRADQDSLLGCLAALTKLFDDPRTPDALIYGLPLENNRLTPALFVRAAERVGLSARISNRKLADIPDMVLPCVLLLKERRACILLSVADGYASVVFPETGEGTDRIPLENLKELYAGYAILTRPNFKYRVEKDERLMDRKGSWFWGTMWQFWPTYLQVIIAAFLINSFALASPLFIMNVYDRVVPNRAMETLWVLAIGVITVIGFDLLLKTLRAYFVDNAGKRADVLLSSRIFEQVLNLQVKARPASAGAFANHLREFETLRDFFTSVTVTALVDLPFLGIFLFIIYLIGGPLFMIPAIAVPVVLVIGLLLQWPMQRAVARTSEEAAQKHGVIIETISALDTVKSMGIEGHMQKEWERFVGKTAETSVAARFFAGLGINLSAAAMQLVTVAVVVYGVHLMGEPNSTMTVGALIASTILTGRTMAPLGQIAGLLTRLNQAMVALKGLNNIMSLPVERGAEKRQLSRPNIQGDIEFKDVTFKYPGSDLPALNNVSFRISAGEKVGIIGPVGSGKTTISRLLINLYEPNEGAVLIDGTDIRQIDPSDIRRSIGSVMQDITLFQATVRQNITLGHPQADDEMILNAARLSGVHDFISKHPHGYDLQVGEKGATMSGGQRQAIGLARAFLPNPPILMLDEPTSAMDLNSERRLIARLEEHIADKTVILVTHRTSLFSLVDRIIVLGNGKIAADGPRDKILKLGQTGNGSRNVSASIGRPALRDGGE